MSKLSPRSNWSTSSPNSPSKSTRVKMRSNWSTGLLRLIHSNKRDMMKRASMIRVNILTRIRGSNMLDLSSEILSLISPKNIL